MTSGRSSKRAASALLAEDEYEVDARRVMDLVCASDCPAYDCEFAALAMQLGAPLVTRDRKLLKAFPSVAEPL